MKNDVPPRARLLAVLDESLRRRIHELYALPRPVAVERTLDLIEAHARAWHVLDEAPPRPAEVVELADRAEAVEQPELAAILRAVAGRLEDATRPHSLT